MRVGIAGDGLSRDYGMCLFVTTGTVDRQEHFHLDYGNTGVRRSYPKVRHSLKSKRIYLTHAHSDHWLHGDLFHHRHTHLEEDDFEIWGPVDIAEYILSGLNSSCLGSRSGLRVHVYEIDGEVSKKTSFGHDKKLNKFVKQEEENIETETDDLGIISLPPFGEGGHTRVRAVYGYHGGSVPVLCYSVEETKSPAVSAHPEIIAGRHHLEMGKWTSDLKRHIEELMRVYDGTEGIVGYLNERLPEDCLPEGVKLRGLMKSKAVEVKPRQDIKFAYVTDTVLTREGTVGNLEALSVLADGSDYLWCSTKSGRSTELGIHMSPDDVIYLAGESSARELLIGHFGMDHDGVVKFLNGVAAGKLSEEELYEVLSEPALDMTVEKDIIKREAADALAAFRDIRKALRGKTNVRIGCSLFRFAPPSGLRPSKNVQKYLEMSFAVPPEDMEGYEKGRRG